MCSLCFSFSTSISEVGYVMGICGGHLSGFPHVPTPWKSLLNLFKSHVWFLVFFHINRWITAVCSNSRSVLNVNITQSPRFHKFDYRVWAASQGSFSINLHKHAPLSAYRSMFVSTQCRVECSLSPFPQRVWMLQIWWEWGFYLKVTYRSHGCRYLVSHLLKEYKSGDIYWILIEIRWTVKVKFTPFNLTEPTESDTCLVWLFPFFVLNLNPINRLVNEQN